MANTVEICNLALAIIGSARITSISDDVESARVLNDVFDIVRDSELRANNWNFAMKRASIAALTTVPVAEFSYEYQLPSDCLRVVEVGEDTPAVSLTSYRSSREREWAISGRKIETDLSSPLSIRYVSRVTDTGKFDAMFVTALACRLASVIANRITDLSDRRSLAMQEYRQAIFEAMRADAIESPPEALMDNSWIISRL